MTRLKARKREKDTAAVTVNDDADAAADAAGMDRRRAF
jgi:hypothetical protein